MSESECESESKSKYIFFRFLSLFNAKIKLDSLSIHLEAMSLSLSVNEPLSGLLLSLLYVDRNSLVVDDLVRHRQHVDDVVYVTEQSDLSSL